MNLAVAAREGGRVKHLAAPDQFTFRDVDQASSATRPTDEALKQAGRLIDTTIALRRGRIAGTAMESLLSEDARRFLATKVGKKVLKSLARILDQGEFVRMLEYVRFAIDDPRSDLTAPTLERVNYVLERSLDVFVAKIEEAKDHAGKRA